MAIKVKYNPIADTLLQHVMMAQKAYDELENQYGQLAEQAGNWEVLGDDETSKQYIASLNQQLNDASAKLANEGLTHTSKKDLINLRKLINQYIVPRQVMYSKKQQLLDEMRKHPELVYNMNPDDITISNLVDNPNLQPKYFDTNYISKLATQGASNLAINKPEFIPRLIQLAKEGNIDVLLDQFPELQKYVDYAKDSDDSEYTSTMKEFMREGISGALYNVQEALRKNAEDIEKNRLQKLYTQAQINSAAALEEERAFNEKIRRFQYTFDEKGNIIGYNPIYIEKLEKEAQAKQEGKEAGKPEPAPTKQLTSGVRVMKGGTEYFGPKVIEGKPTNGQTWWDISFSGGSTFTSESGDNFNNFTPISVKDINEDDLNVILQDTGILPDGNYKELDETKKAQAVQELIDNYSLSVAVAIVDRTGVSKENQKHKEILYRYEFKGKKVSTQSPSSSSSQSSSQGSVNSTQDTQNDTNEGLKG